MLFADDAEVTTHTQQELQALMDRFSQACKDFGVTISLKKTNVLGQDTMELPAITIDHYELDVFEQFIYLGSTITDNLSLDTEMDKKIEKAATTLARLTSRVWTNPKLTVKNKMVVYNACVVSTLMYGSETWTTYARQEKRLSSFHLRSIRRILGISWQDSVQRRGPVASQPSKHVHPAQTAQACFGWVMPTAWRMTTSQKTFSTESWHLNGESKAPHSCATKMSPRQT